MQSRTGKSLRGLALAGLAGLALSAGVAQAQPKWQSTYQYRGWTDGRGVVVMDDGGTTMAGFTEGMQGPGSSDVYVVRTNQCGAPLWEYAYDIGGDEKGNRIRRTPDGGFIVVGMTEDLNNNECGLRDDIFLLKLDANGAVQWTHVYGGNSWDEGADVRVLDDGYIIAGTTESYGSGSEDGYLIRTDHWGTPVWSSTYGGPLLDRFYCCNIATNGDILAAGWTSSFSASPSERDIFLVRVDANTGLPVGSFPMHYGGNRNDMATGVVDLGTDLVLTGGTTSYGGVSEGFLLRTTSYGYVSYMKTVGGMNGGGWEEFVDMDMDIDRNLYVTGMWNDSPQTFGNLDMFVGMFDHSLNLIHASIHGDWDLDVGFGIAYGADNGLAVTGFSNNFRIGAGDLYGVRSDLFGVSGCHDYFPDVSIHDVYPSYAPCEISPVAAVRHCAVGATRGDYGDAYIRLCSDCPRKTVNGSDGISANNDAAGTLALTIYPNPVTNQRTLTLEHASVPGVEMELTITDMNGLIILNEHHPAGESRVEIDTKGWPAGSYMMKATIGERTETRRIVVAGE